MAAIDGCAIKCMFLQNEIDIKIAYETEFELKLNSRQVQTLIAK